MMAYYSAERMGRLKVDAMAAPSGHCLVVQKEFHLAGSMDALMADLWVLSLVVMKANSKVGLKVVLMAELSVEMMVRYLAQLKGL